MVAERALFTRAWVAQGVCWRSETGGQLPGQPPRSRWEPWRLLSQGQPQCLTFPKGAPHLGDLAVGAEALAPN